MRKTTTKTVKTKSTTEIAPPSFNHSMDIKDYIIQLDNFIDEELCDQVVAEFKNSEEWQQTAIGYGAHDRSIRNADTILMSTQPVIDKNYVVRKKLDNNLFEVAGKAILEYNKLFPKCVINQDSGYQLLRYKKGQFYVEHTDSYHMQPRSISCSMILNDDFEGGEFAFFGRSVIHKPKKRSILMFPSSFMYPHEIMPVTKGTRYSIITWFL